MPEHVVDNITAVMFDDELEKKELATQIKTVLDDLPNDYQVVLRLKYIEGEKVQTIARKLSMGFKATESLIFRARKAFVSIWKTSNAA
jgi:RNA polymerase sigma-70 factor (ECF subfamily)